MTAGLLPLAMTLVRTWTRVYTHGLPQAERNDRQAEIESDLWEFTHDPDAPQGGWAAMQILARLLTGIPDDVAWRIDAGATAHHAPVSALAEAGLPTGPRRVSAFGVAATIHVVAILAVTWMATRAQRPWPFPPVKAARGQTGIEHRFTRMPSSLNQRVTYLRTSEPLTPMPGESAVMRANTRGLDVVSAVAVSVAVRLGLMATPRPIAQAPSAANGPVFEVASIKPNPAGRDGPTERRVLPGGRFVAVNIPVALLIGEAYQVQAYRLIGAPRWIWSDAFDINAKADGDLAPDGPRRPLQHAMRGLLEDRFRLIAHMEVRQLPVYALELAHTDGRLGPNLTHSSRTDCDAILARLAQERAAQGLGGGPPPPPPPSSGFAPPCGGMNRPGAVAIDSGTLARLAGYLAGELNTMVVDRTGLKGLFNARLTWTPDQPPSGSFEPSLPAIDPNAPSIFTAVQEQLGLKLQRTIGPVDVLVIDRIEHPTKN
jgi:uncharacterized protein (TIGR03435 family)